MVTPETLAARPAKDAKFAHMVSLGLAKGHTKAGWAQARRPGKRVSLWKRFLLFSDPRRSQTILFTRSKGQEP